MNLRLVLVCVAFFACPEDGWAWGATGHEWVSGIAIEMLPDIVPVHPHSQSRRRDCRAGP